MVDPITRDVLRPFAWEGIQRFIGGEPAYEAVAPRLSALEVAEHDEARVVASTMLAHETLRELDDDGHVAYTEPSPMVDTRAVLTPSGRRVIATGFVPDAEYADPLPPVCDHSAPVERRYATLLFEHCDRADEVRDV